MTKHTALPALAIAALLFSQCQSTPPGKDTSPTRPRVVKLGTIDCDMVETTPMVFRGKLYRFESVRPNYKPNRTGDSYFRFIDVESGEPTAAFAAGYHLGTAVVHEDTVVVYGVDKWGKSNIQVFWSADLETWASRSALELEGWEIFNTTVCRGRDSFIMAFEVGGPPEIAGTRFTYRFATSRDLLSWRLMPEEFVFTKDRYSACPTLTFLDDRYYMIYLELRPGRTFEPYIIRSSDLSRWESRGTCSA